MTGDAARSSRLSLLSRDALRGRVALVTGAGRLDGIGAAVARSLAAAGAAVAVNDLGRPTPVEDETGAIRGEPDPTVLVEQLRAAGAEARFVPGDIAQDDGGERVVAACRSELGSCDIVVNNAAAPHGEDRNTIERVPPAALDAQLAVNVRGTFLITRAAVPGMRAQRWGRIINIASLAAIKGVRQRAAYAASKSALLGLTLSLAADLAEDGVTVNAICPGVILTGRNLTTFRREDADEGSAVPSGRSPVGRAGRPDDIAGAVVFFASDLAEYVTGQVLAVDGGYGVVLHPPQAPG